MSDQGLVFAGLGFGVGFLIVGFFLAGAHHEIAHRRRQKRHGGWV